MVFNFASVPTYKSVNKIIKNKNKNLMINCFVLNLISSIFIFDVWMMCGYYNWKNKPFIHVIIWNFNILCLIHLYLWILTLNICIICLIWNFCILNYTDVSYNHWFIETWLSVWRNILITYWRLNVLYVFERKFFPATSVTNYIYTGMWY